VRGTLFSWLSFTYCRLSIAGVFINEVVVLSELLCCLFYAFFSLEGIRRHAMVASVFREIEGTTSRCERRPLTSTQMGNGNQFLQNAGTDSFPSLHTYLI
jgi:hypothetical protein